MQTIFNAINLGKIFRPWRGHAKMPQWWLRIFLPNWLIVFSTVTGLVLGALSFQEVAMAAAPGSYQSNPAPGATLNIGGSTVGTPVSNSSLGVTNGGGTTLTISNAATTGANPGDFSVTLPPIPFTLPGGASQNVTIQCTPGAGGPRTATLTFTTDDPSNPNPFYNLTCTGLVPAFSSVPAPGGTLNFGNVPVGGSATASIAVSNPNPPATGTLVVNGYGIGGPNSGSFQVTAPPAPFSVNVGQTVNIVVQCTPPPVAGMLTATLTITTNAPSPNNFAMYNLSCTGVIQPKFTSVPAPPGPLTMTSLINTPSAPVTIAVTNTGSPGSTLTVTVNPPAAPFTAGPATLNVVQGSPAQNISVSCTPTQPTQNGTLTLTTNDPNLTTVSYNLTCNGQAPIYSSAPAPGATININAPVGGSNTSTINVTNTGNAALNVSAPAGLSGVLSVAPNAVYSLAPAAAQAVILTCTPTAIGTVTQTLSYTTNDPALTAVNYTVNCIGSGPIYTSNPVPGATINITAPVGGSNTSTINVTNTGNAALNVSAPAGLSAPLSVTPVGAYSLNATLSQAVVITCAPASTAPVTQTLSYTTNDPALPNVSYTVTCTGQAPVYSSAPAPGATININAPVGGSNTSTINVTNTGNVALNVSAPAGLGAPLSVAPNATYNLAPAGTQAVTLTCAPTSTATVTQTLTYTTNDPTHNPVTYTVNCTGQVPVYTSNPAPGATININALVGSSSSSNISVTNTGAAPLNVSAPGGLSGVLTVTPTTPYSVAPAGNQLVTITCTPITSGTVTQTLSYTTNDPTNAAVNYTVNCIGTAPVYSSNPAPGATINITAPVGGSATSDIIVTNTGNASLDVFNQTGLSGVLSVTPNTAFNLTPASSQTVTITCAPISAGTVTQTFSSDTTDPTKPTVTYTVNCTGQGPLYTSTPAPNGSFTIVAPLGGSNTQVINVTNGGNQTLNVSAPTGLSAPLSVTPVAAYALNAAASQAVTVTCTPITTAPVTQTLTYTTDDTTHATVTYTITCTGQGPTYSSTPAPGATININAPVGSSNTSTINVTNTGATTLNVSAPAGLAAPLSVAPNAAYTLAATVSQVVTITCAPTTTAPATQTLTYTTNDIANPTVTYTVNCTGQVPVYSSTPAPGATIAITAAVGGSNTSTINVTNTGGATLNVSAPAGLSGGLSVTPATAYNLGAASGQAVTITCSPTATTTLTQTLSYTTNDTTKPTVTYTVSCTGVLSPVYSSSPVAPGGTINFGGSPIGVGINFSLTIQNNGAAPLTVALPAGGAITGPNAADFSLTTASFPLTLAPTATQAVIIRCTPSGAGARSATLSFNTNDLARPTVTYTLSCSALAPGSFGSRPVAPGGTIYLTSPAVGVAVSTKLGIENTGASPFAVTGQTITGPNAADFGISTTFPFTVTAGGLVPVVIICTPSAATVRTATLTLTTSLAGLPQVNYTLQCNVNVQKKLPAELELQLTVSPDREVSNKPDNLISYNFKVRNIGEGRANLVYLVLPVDAKLIIGYTKFSDPKAWVIETLATSVKIQLPDLESNGYVTGSIYFRPSTDPTPALGAKVSTRFTTYYDDATGTGWKRYSNAVNFSFTDKTNLSSGGVQWLAPTSMTGSAGSKLNFTADFLAPDERVTGWLTKPDGKSIELTGTDRGRASANGAFTLTVDTAGMLPGTYSLTIYGNKSQVTGNASMVVTSPKLTPETSRITAGAKLNFDANFLAYGETASAWLTGPDGKSHDLKKERANTKGEFSLALDTTGMTAGSYKVVVYGNNSTLKATANLVISGGAALPAQVQTPATQPDQSKDQSKGKTPVTETPAKQTAPVTPTNPPVTTAPVPATDPAKAIAKVETKKFFQLLGSANLKSGAKTSYTAEHLTSGELASAWITGPNGKSVALGSSHASAQGKYSLTLNTSGLAPGTYTVAVQGNSSQVISSMVIVIA